MDNTQGQVSKICNTLVKETSIKEIVKEAI